jgi:hypothetical protein
MSTSSSSYRPRCIYLTCKSMQVWGEDFENDPEYQAGMVEFWCTQTFKNQGPDGDFTSLELCSDPQRSCFREFLDLSTGPTPMQEDPATQAPPGPSEKR